MSRRAAPSPAGAGTPLRELSWKSPGAARPAGFPWDVPAVRALAVLDLSAPVTFFVGENGSGKSTLLEAIAAAARLETIGSAHVDRDPTLDAQRALASALRLSWRWKPTRGFYLRAEDFFGWLKFRARDRARLLRERAELARWRAEREAERARAERRHLGVDENGDLVPASAPGDEGRVWSPTDAPVDENAHPDEIGARAFLGEEDARSHGESFMDLFTARVTPGGLYLLDEPEAPLSPQRQLAFLALMAEAVQGGAQFVVATHSPILLAYPGARLYEFDGTGPVRAVAYEELEHVRVTRDFLAAPERFLRHLL